jgi:hypothetical protein
MHGRTDSHFVSPLSSETVFLMGMLGRAVLELSVMVTEQKEFFRDWPIAASCDFSPRTSRKTSTSRSGCRLLRVSTCAMLPPLFCNDTFVKPIGDGRQDGVSGHAVNGHHTFLRTMPNTRLSTDSAHRNLTNLHYAIDFCCFLVFTNII